ncbi:MAG TPA: hypothetical protein VM791_17365 [Vicinamibacterales bacterium]|nr:hypothetical protein [Vicinamibacterales bacterium]
MRPPLRKYSSRPSGENRGEVPPLTYLAVPAVLLGVVLLACLPARQAAKVHSVEALRAE